MTYASGNRANNKLSIIKISRYKINNVKYINIKVNNIYFTIKTIKNLLYFLILTCFLYIINIIEY